MIYKYHEPTTEDIKHVKCLNDITGYERKYLIEADYLQRWAQVHQLQKLFINYGTIKK